MEFLLRFLVLPVWLVGSIVYCLSIRAALMKWPRLAPFCWRLSLMGIAMVGACAALIAWPGPAYLVKHWDLYYTLFYQFCFLIGPLVAATPMLVVAVKQKKGWLATFVVPAVICYLVSAFFLFADIFVYEAAFGPG